MAEFKFLQIYQDRYDHWIGHDQMNGNGESWQEALQNELKLLSDKNLDETYDIFRFEDGNFESCQDEIWTEHSRRREIREEKNKQQLIREQQKKQEEKLALYLELKKEFG